MSAYEETEMSITLDLPQELEKELQMEAAQYGLPLPAYVQRLLSTTTIMGNKPRNGAELVDYWRNEGLIGMRQDVPDSQTHARQLRDRAERRPRD